MLYGILLTMQIVLAIFSLGFLGTIIYFAVSQKSSRFLKLAAFIALGLIAVSVAVAGFFILMGPGEPEVFIPIPALQNQPAQAPQDNNIMGSVIFFLIFVIILGVIIYAHHRDQKKKNFK